MKKVLKAAWKGISVSAVIFVVSCMIRGFGDGAEKFSSGTGMGYLCLAAIAIGIGFGVPSLIYNTDLPTGLKVLIHMGIGITVMLAVSVAVGLIDFSRGFTACLIVAGVQIAVAFTVWALSCVRVRRLAKEMNGRIAEKK
ncbi:MAG: DUF3021 domain-containing protein [Clostridia bacterium]|nr:DUF3021 domain-containing protein [Clostridia bacterium]